jgi:S-DNA-T family DNA segregation ATPase FtsK/SpoIIIE
VDLDLRIRAGGHVTAVTVRAGPDATVGDLRRALPDAPAAIRVGGRPLADDERLLDAGLFRGALIDCGGPGTERAAEHVPAPDAALEVAVSGGRWAGRRVALAADGAVTVGRDASCALAVPDPEVSRTHARIRSTVDGPTVTDEGSTNATRLGAWRIDGPTPVRPGATLGMGETVLTVRPPVAADADISVDPATGDHLFNRPPRIAPPATLPELVVPVPPDPPGGWRFPWAATLLPLLLCGGLLLIPSMRAFGPYLLLMCLLSPVMAVTNLVSDRRHGRKEYAAKRTAHDRAEKQFTRALAAAARAEEDAERAANPDPAELAARAGVRAPGRSAKLWQRRRADPDFLRLRVGLADRPARIALRTPSADDRPELPTVYDVPVTVDLADAGVLGVAGPADATRAAGRALLAQAATLHAPTDLGIVIVTGRDTAADWEWAGWLPHTRPVSSAFACARLFATDAAQAEARLAELRRLVEERTAERRSLLAAGPPAGRALLVLLDGARRLRDLPGLADLLTDGPAAGVHAICLDADETALPDECRATVVTTGTRARVSRPGLMPVDDVLLDGFEAGPAADLGPALAPLRVLGERGDDSALPDRVRFTALTDTTDVMAGWRRSPAGRSTTALLGVGADGPVTVDLRRDGPHALIAGTSGSGKSELLQTLVTALALANTPDAMNFVLVDYKGGSAFAACAELPHCVGLVTDLDGHLVTRALGSLGAELRRREALFAAAGATDIDDYWARSGARLPRLVIVVDEFASLVEEVPEFVSGVVGIGMRGRSLGVHVVLATQRPAGVVTADLRANVNLRISLRVTSPQESADVIEATDAAAIPARQPGRAYLRTGPGELTAFQTARVGWPSGSAAPEREIALTCVPRPVTALGAAPTATACLSPGEATTAPDHDGGRAVETRTDLTDLVAAMRTAAATAGIAAPPGPWLPPLPDLVPLAAVPAPSLGRGGPAAAVLGLVDRPHAQAQDPFVVDLESTGPLAVAGTGRSGRSTALRTLAASLASGASPADLHLYALDCGNRALAALRLLPHCGAVVDGDDSDRVERLLDFLHRTVAGRQAVLAAGGHGGLAEQRSSAAAPDRLPYIVVLLDRLETYVNRYGERDGGRLVDRLEALLRTGPATGITVVLGTDRLGFGHRIASAVTARLVLRQATRDEVGAYGLDPRSVPRRMPPGRALWAAADSPEEVQIALLESDPAGSAQTAAVERLARALSARWDGVPDDRMPHRIDPLPEEVTAAVLEGWRCTPRPAGSTVATPAAGGDRLGPVDVDLAVGGATFLVGGPPRSGRSTALLAIVSSLGGRADGSLPVLVVAPRPSPLADVAGLPGVLGVLTGDPAGIAAGIATGLAAVDGPVALVVDDAELLTDLALTDALERFARYARDTGSVLVAAATTEDALAARYRGWLATVRRSRRGLLLNPASHVDGELFDLRLPRSLTGGWPAGRALLVDSGTYTTVQVPVTDVRALRTSRADA